MNCKKHQNARCNDPVLLDFLDSIRDTQPTKDVPREFFSDRWLAPGRNCKDDNDIYEAVQESMRLEADNRNFTFLTITNQGATRLNHTRCLAKFGDRPEMNDAGLDAAQGDPEHGGLVVAVKRLETSAHEKHRQEQELCQRRSQQDSEHCAATYVYWWHLLWISLHR